MSNNFNKVFATVTNLEQGTFNTTDGSKQDSYMDVRVRTGDYTEVVSNSYYTINVPGKNDLQVQIYEYDEYHTKLKYTGEWKTLPFKVCFLPQTKYINIVFKKTDGTALTVNYIQKVEIKLNNYDIYSIEEQQIGYWIDGKPVYRKVIDVGNLPNATTKRIAHNISNLKQVISIEGYYRSSSYTFKFPHVTDTYFVIMYTTGTYVEIVSNIDRSGFTGMAILDYTKTTD